MRLAVASILLAAASAAPAQDWELIARTPEMTTRLDRASVRKVGAFLTAWIRFEYSEARPAPPNDSRYSHYDTSVEQDRIDCRGFQSVTLQRVLFIRDAPVASLQLSQLAPMKEPVPGSIGEAIIRAACRAPP